MVTHTDRKSGQVWQKINHIHLPLQYHHRLVVYTLNAQHGRGTIQPARLAADQHENGTDLFIESLSTSGR
jgi:hypothetical protein